MKIKLLCLTKNVSRNKTAPAKSGGQNLQHQIHGVVDRESTNETKKGDAEDGERKCQAAPETIREIANKWH